MDDASHQDFAVFLRGVNVGGKNVMPMAALRGCLESAGFTSVETYIQSGNVILRSAHRNTSTVAGAVTAALQSLGYGEPSVVLAAAGLRAVVSQAPLDFGSEPDVYRYDVLFPVEGITPRSVLPELPVNPAVDAAWAGDNALYYRRLVRLASQSHLSRLAKLPLYKRLTIRNWATTTRMLALVTARSPAAPSKP